MKKSKFFFQLSVVAVAVIIVASVVVVVFAIIDVAVVVVSNLSSFASLKANSFFQMKNFYCPRFFSKWKKSSH